MSIRGFYLQWLRRGLTGPLPKVRLAAFLLAIAGGAVGYFVPEWESSVRNWVWAVSVVVFVGSIMIGFLVAPYQIYKDIERVRDKLAKHLEEIKLSAPDLVFCQTRVVPIYGPAIRFVDDPPQNREPDYYMVQAWFLNAPTFASEACVAKRITAIIEHGNQTWHGEWAISEDAAKAGFDETKQAIDIEPNHIPGKLILAIKYPKEDSCYIYATDSPTFKDDRKELSTGDHKIKVKLSGRNVGPNQEFNFTLSNLGVGGRESLKLTSANDP